MIDFETTLYSSKRTYINEIDADQFVFFSPDRKGLPFLGKQKLKAVFDKYQNGSTLLQCLQDLDITSKGDFLRMTQFLYEKGALKTDSRDGRYEAKDFPHPDRIRSMAIWLHINNACNLGCGYCYVNKDKSKMSKEVLVQTLDRIYETGIKRNLDSITVKFAGGESTLSLNELFWSYDYLTTKFEQSNVKLHFSILSNGTILNERLIEFLKKDNVSISISLDGFGSESHDIHRTFVNSKVKRGSWNLIMDNIDQMLQQNIRPYILTTISEESADTLPALVEWIISKKLRTRLGVVRQPGNTWTNIQERRQEYDKLIAKMIDAFERTFTLLEEDRFDFNLQNTLSICELHFEQPSFSATCGIGSNHIVIQEDGKLASCPMTLKESNVEPDNDLLLSIRKTFSFNPANRNLTKEKNCLDCNWFPVCTSGCHVNNERVTGEAFTISPLHDFYAYIIPRYINFYGVKLLQKARKQPNEIEIIS